ncbi:MAG: hypothetical protein WCH01_09240 [Methylococcaceae bacterium]
MFPVPMAQTLQRQPELLARAELAALFAGANRLDLKPFIWKRQISTAYETYHKIRNGQLSDENIPTYKQFMALAE